MTPVRFPEANVTLAKDQPEYLPLPAHRAPDGVVVSCWRLGWRERLKLLLTGRLWLLQHTFGDPLQAQSPSADYPFVPQPVEAPAKT